MVRYTRILTTYWIVQTLSGRGDGGTPRTAVVSLPGSSEHRSNHRDANSKVFPGLGRILIVGLFCWRSPPANRNGRTISSEAPAPKHRSISLEERAGDCRRPARRRSFPARCSGRLVNQWSRFQRALLLLVDAEDGASLGSKPKGRVVPTPFSSADSSD